MSLTTITINAVAYESYASVAEAGEYLAVDPNRWSAWGALDDTAKTRNLVGATRRLNALQWAGRKAAEGQAAEWPRSELKDRDGDNLDDTTIPPQIEHATILLAGDLAVDPMALSGEVSEAAVQSQRIGPKSVSYFRERQTRLQQLLGGNDLVIDLIKRWLAPPSMTPPLALGTDAESAFAWPDQYGRTRGL